jgi:pimeloyl-ACP methyl ester carboxylesterase
MREPGAVGVGLLIFLLSALGGFGAACTDDDTVGFAPDASARDSGSDDGPDTSTPKLAFKACPGGYSGACATVDVPLDYAKPEGRKIPILIDRIVSTTHPRGQLWLLQGGPGGTAADMSGIAMLLAPLVPDLDIYTVEHRGVGASSRLGCPAETPGATDTSLQACLDALNTTWGADGLAQFTTSNAARDLDVAVERIRNGSDQKAFVYGVSYGTYWAHRYLQIFPNKATGVILDSIVPPVGLYISGFDTQFDPQAKKLAEICKTTPACVARLGADPWKTLETIRDEIADGHCPGTLTRENRRVLSAMLQSYGSGVYAFAALARYHRCSAEDVTALTRFLAAVKQAGLAQGGPNAALEGPYLGFNVIVSELWEDPSPPFIEMDIRYQQHVFVSGAVGLWSVKAIWPVYPRDQYVGEFAKTDVPLLMLNGTIDFQTPYEVASTMGPHFTAPHQTFVTVDHANHAVVAQSPVRTAGAPPCGAQIIASFLKDPLATPNTTCLGDLAPISFEGMEQDSLFLFGTSSTWEAAPPASPERVRAAPEPAWMRELRQLPDPLRNPRISSP